LTPFPGDSVSETRALLNLLASGGEEQSVLDQVNASREQV